MRIRLPLVLLFCTFVAGYGFLASTFEPSSPFSGQSFAAGSQPSQNPPPSRWSGKYKVTSTAPRGSSTLLTVDAGSVQFTVNGTSVKGSLKGHVEAKMTGTFSLQGASDYTAALLGIVRKASQSNNLPLGMSSAGEVATLNAGTPTPLTFPMSGVVGTPPHTHSTSVQHPSPAWPLSIVLVDGYTSDYDFPRVPMLQDTGHVTVTIHKLP